MIPAFHCVLDLHVGDHDDPQHFDIAAWSDALQERIVTLHNVDAPHPTMRVMAAVAAADDFSTPTARSRTKSGKGGSKTTGLRGKLLQPAQGVEVIDATETLTAFRDGHALGDARTVRQVRTKKDGKTLIEQPDYCWGKPLPNAELIESSPGFGHKADFFEGKATFFGKSDTEDEGTGSAAFGTVQTDSSVFGVSLKRARLISEGLARQDAKHVLRPTERAFVPSLRCSFPLQDGWRGCRSWTSVPERPAPPRPPLQI